MHSNTAPLAVAAFLALVMPAVAAGPAPQCNVELAVTDNDPKGLNVRSEPDIKGSVVGVLKGGDYIVVHITGKSGEWYAIDSATMYDTNAPGTGQKVVFKGKGFVHESKVGASGLDGGTDVFDRPDDKSGKKIKWDKPYDEDVKVLGCSGTFLKIQGKKTIGWSNAVCTNELTTCV